MIKWITYLWRGDRAMSVSVGSKIRTPFGVGTISELIGRDGDWYVVKRLNTFYRYTATGRSEYDHRILIRNVPEPSLWPQTWWVTLHDNGKFETHKSETAAKNFAAKLTSTKCLDIKEIKLG